MFNKLAITALVMMSTTTYAHTHITDNYSTCAVEVALSVPPILPNERVVFNVTSDRGTNKAVTLKSGDESAVIGNLICSSVAYTISATLYSSPMSPLTANNQIGQCALKAGPVVLDEAFDNVSVVFPNDFNCA